MKIGTKFTLSLACILGIMIGLGLLLFWALNSSAWIRDRVDFSYSQLITIKKINKYMNRQLKELSDMLLLGEESEVIEFKEYGDKVVNAFDKWERLIDHELDYVKDDDEEEEEEEEVEIVEDLKTAYNQILKQYEKIMSLHEQGNHDDAYKLLEYVSEEKFEQDIGNIIAEVINDEEDEIKHANEKAIAFSKRILFIAFLVIGFGLLTLILVFAFLNMSIVRPIKYLQEVAQKARKKEFNQEINTNSRDEIGDLAESIKQMSDELHQAIINVEKERDTSNRLNIVLKTIRNINQLITKEKDQAKLLTEACNNFTRDRGYFSVMIMLMDNERQVTSIVESGLEKELAKIEQQIETGNIPFCMKKATEHQGVLVIKNHTAECSHCPICKANPDGEIMAMQLNHSDRYYGTLLVSLQKNITADKEEEELFFEVGEDISFALYNIEAEQSRQKTEEEKKKIKNQLLHVQKMDAIGKLTGGIAHDFNNLLTAISGYVEVLKVSLDCGNTQYKMLTQIGYASERAARLTNQLLLFSRNKPMEFYIQNINNIVEGLEKMLKRIIGEDIAIETELGEGLWNVKADLGNLEQVITNISLNARDAMPQGGVIKIVTRNVEIDEDYCKEFEYARPGQFICISFEDTGVGMDESVIEHIFEPFYTTKGLGKGTGLGLSVVYGIIKEHDGWIIPSSRIGEGTRFDIYLPAALLNVKDRHKISTSENIIKGGNEAILLVEDEEIVHQFIFQILSKQGYKVLMAKNLQEAQQIFDEQQGNIDLILSDVVLPDGSGISLYDTFISRKPGIKFLLSSGYTDSKSQWQVIKEKQIPFIQKPYKVHELLHVIKDILTSKTSVNI